MKDVYKSSMLYDFYGELLTEHQKEIYINMNMIYIITLMYLRKV